MQTRKMVQGFVLLFAFVISACSSRGTPLATFTAVSYDRVTPIAPTPPPEDVQVIRRVEGENVQVWVASVGAGFMDPSAPRFDYRGYQTSDSYYTLDGQTHRIIAINPIKAPVIQDGLSPQELEKLARDLILRASPEINLDALTPEYGAKISNHFFRWTDTNKQFTDGSHPYIQVGLTGKGELLNYINTIALVR